MRCQLLQSCLWIWELLGRSSTTGRNGATHPFDHCAVVFVEIAAELEGGPCSSGRDER